MSKKLFLIYSLKLLFCLSTKCYSFQFYWQISLSKLHVRLHWKPFVPNLCNIGQEVSVSTIGYKLPKSQTHFKARCWGTRNLSSSIHPFSSFHIQGKGKVGNILYTIREVVSSFQANKKLKYTKKTHIGSWEEKNINTRTARLQLPGRFKHTNISMQACSRGKGSTLMFGR